MRDRSARISRLKEDRQARESYINAKVGVLVPSQIKALRLKSRTPKQTDLAKYAGTHQSRLSNLEKPGEANVTLETLAWIASIHKVGLVVKFVPFSEMLHWENSYSQDTFTVMPIEQDISFLSPGLKMAELFSTEVRSGEYRDFTKMGKDGVMQIKTTVPDRKLYSNRILTKVSNG